MGTTKKTFPIRGISKAEVAKAMELQTEGYNLAKITKRLGKRITLVQSALVRAKRFGFDAWGKQ